MVDTAARGGGGSSFQLPRIAGEDYEQRKRALDTFLALMQGLAAFRESCVLIGGWIPFFLAGRGRKNRLPHPGSLDIDLLFDPDGLRGRTDELHQRLEACGFYHSYSGPRFTYYRDIRREGMEPLVIKCDLVCGDHQVDGRPVRYRKIKGLTLRTARAGTLALFAPLSVRLEWCGEALAFRMADPLTFLVLKGMVIAERERIKDAFDVYHLIHHSRLPARELATVIRPALGDPVVREGLLKLLQAFADPQGSGPYGATRFLEVEDRDEAERFRIHVQRTVFVFLCRLGFAPDSPSEEVSEPICFPSPPPLIRLDDLTVDYLDLVDDLYCGACRSASFLPQIIGSAPE